MPRPSRAASTKPLYSGTVTNGRIKTIVRGQGTGIISAPSGDVFFHKSDFQGSFLDLAVGDKVIFELLADSISGPRAQNVRVATVRKAR
jgi:cold shock CspA family protein